MYNSSAVLYFQKLSVMMTIGVTYYILLVMKYLVIQEIEENKPQFFITCHYLCFWQWKLQFEGFLVKIKIYLEKICYYLFIFQ